MPLSVLHQSFFDCTSANISELNRKQLLMRLFTLRSIEDSAVIFVGPAFDQGSVGKVQIFYKKDILEIAFLIGQFLSRKDHEIRKPQFEVPMIDNF